MVFLSCKVDPVLTRGQTEQNLSNRIHPPVLTLDIKMEGEEGGGRRGLRKGLGVCMSDAKSARTNRCRCAK